MRRPRWCTRWASSRARRPAGGLPVHLRVAADLFGLPSLPRHWALHQTQEPCRQESRCLAGDDAVSFKYFCKAFFRHCKTHLASFESIKNYTKITFLVAPLPPFWKKVIFSSSLSSPSQSLSSSSPPSPSPSSPSPPSPSPPQLLVIVSDDRGIFHESREKVTQAKQVTVNIVILKWSSSSS